MEKNNKKYVIAATAVIVVLAIILIGSLLRLVGLKQLGNANGSGNEKFISYGKTKKKNDNKTSNDDNTTGNELNEVDLNQIDINAFVENILLRDGAATTTDTIVDANGSTVAAQSNPSNQGQRQSVDVGSLGHELDPGDLMMFTDLINRADYNPFVVRTYSNVDSLNVFNLFYDGAGDTASREANVATEYKEVTGRDPQINDNIVKVRVSYIEDLLRRRIGKVPDNWRESMSLSTYSDKYQAYYRENMDTEYMTFKVLKGYVNGNTYTLVYQSVYTSDVNGTVTMVKQDNGEYRFVSNYIKNGFNG